MMVDSLKYCRAVAVRAIVGAASALLLLPMALAQDAPAPLGGDERSAKPQQHPLDVIVFVSLPGMRNIKGATVQRSLDGQLKIVFSDPRRIEEVRVGVTALSETYVETRADFNGTGKPRAKVYLDLDPSLQSRLIDSSKRLISSLGIPESSIKPVYAEFDRWVQFHDRQAVQFVLHPRAELANLNPRIEANGGTWLVQVGEISVAETLAQIRQERQLAAGESQRRAEAQRNIEEHTSKVIAGLGGLGDRLIPFVLPAKRASDGKVTERRYCAVRAGGEMEVWLGGFRYAKDLNDYLGTKRTLNFDLLANDVESLYGLVQAGKCEVLIVSAEDAAKLAAAMRRDQIVFTIPAAKPKADLVANYAEARGYKSVERWRTAREMLPASPVSQADLDRLQALGVVSATDLFEVSDRVKKAGYASEPTLAIVFAFLSDEKAGKESRKSAMQVKAEREKKELADKKAQDAAEAAKRAAFAKEFPYYAVISCGMPDHINIMICFSGTRGVGTELKVNNGGNSQMYKPYNIGAAGSEEDDGLHIDLRQKFEIFAQNADETMILTVKIFDRKTDKVIFTNQAAKFGVVRVRN